MRRLAAELDVTPRALYRYVNDKEDLLQGVADAVLSELRPPTAHPAVDRVGLVAVQPKVDFGRVMGHVRDAQAHIAPNDSPERRRAAGVEVLRGHARFAGPGRLLVDAGGGADGVEVGWRAALLATGSRPVLPELPGLPEAGPLTSDTVWELKELPERLLARAADQAVQARWQRPAARRLTRMVLAARRLADRRG
jgi:AcrR family transcriptional regulator